MSNTPGKNQAKFAKVTFVGRTISLCGGGLGANLLDESKPALATLTTEELQHELLRRKAAQLDGKMLPFERQIEQSMIQHHAALTSELLRQQAETETDEPKPCPKCGQSVGVKIRRRERTIRTVSGTQTFRRNYHYCETCQQGFCPLDAQLGLPESGELSHAMRGRVLDFAVTSTYAEAVSRWNVH